MIKKEIILSIVIFALLCLTLMAGKEFNLLWIPPRKNTDGSIIKDKDIAGYNIYYGYNNSNYFLYRATTKNSENIKLSYSGFLYFRVSCYNTDGMESEKSNFKKWYFTDNNLKITNMIFNNGTINVFWTPFPNAIYDIYCKTNLLDTKEWELLETTTNTEYKTSITNINPMFYNIKIHDFF